jgi:hypothetical protein
MVSLLYVGFPQTVKFGVQQASGRAGRPIGSLSANAWLMAGGGGRHASAGHISCMHAS